MQTKKIPNENYIKAVQSHIGRGIRIKVDQLNDGYLGSRFDISITKGSKIILARFVIRNYFDCGTLLINDYYLMDAKAITKMFGGTLHISTVKKAVTMMLDFYTYKLGFAIEFSEGRGNTSNGYNLLSTIDRGNHAFVSFIENFEFERLVDFTNPNYIGAGSIDRRSIVMLKGKQECITDKYKFLDVINKRLEKEKREERTRANIIRWG